MSAPVADVRSGVTPATAETARFGSVRRALSWLDTRPTWHLLLLLFVVALAVRLIVAVGVAVFLHGSVNGDDLNFHELAGAMAAGKTGSWPQSLRDQFYENGSFLVPLSIFYKVVGAHQYLGQCVVALLGALVAWLTARVALVGAPRRWALAAGAVVALLPSQVLFSSTTLKDAVAWACLAGLALIVARAPTERGRRLLLLAAGVAVIFVTLRYLRIHTLGVACVALVIAAWMSPREGRVMRGLGAIALVVLVPWAVNLGPAAYRALPSSGRFAEYRELQATGETAIYRRTPKPKPATKATPTPTTEPAAEPAPAKTRLDDIRDLPTGLSVILLQPYPWGSSHNLSLRLARVETLLWYPLLLLAAVGLLELRRRPDVFAFPALIIAGLSLKEALGEGNLGTAFRHRGEFIWATAVLAVAGGRLLWCRYHRDAAAGTE